MTNKEKKYTNEDLATMQAYCLERKIQIAQTRIIEFATRIGGEQNIYVAFSGGKDSTVLLDLVRRIYPNVPAVFIDTGLEYPAIRDFVKTIENVIWLKPAKNFRQVIQDYGYPLISKQVAHTVSIGKNAIKKGRDSFALQQLNGTAIDPNNGELSLYNKKRYKFLLDAPFEISDQCCYVMKKRPAHKFEKETGLKPILGTMACESQMRKRHWLTDGCNSFENKNPSSKPLSVWLEKDILHYISKFNIPYASVYGDIIPTETGYTTTGLDRTGCAFCLFGITVQKEPNRLQRLQKDCPKIYDYCMRDCERGGLGMKNVIDWINENGNMDIKY